MLRDLQASTRSKRKRRDRTARLGSARQRLLPVQPVDADHQPLFVLPPDDVGGLDAGVLHMGRYDGEIVGIERNQFELIGRRHRGPQYPQSLMRWIDAPQA